LHSSQDASDIVADRVLSQVASYDWAKSGDDAIANRSYHAISALLGDMKAAAPKTGPLAKLLNQGP